MGFYKHNHETNVLLNIIEKLVMLSRTILIWTTHLKYGWLGDMVICSTSLVMSSSEKASFRLSDSRITFVKSHNYVSGNTDFLLS